MTVKGIDGKGASPGSEVRLNAPPNRPVTLDSKTLEEGGDGFQGAWATGT